MGQSCWKAKEEATDSDRATQGHGAYAADSDAPALAHTEGEWDTLPHHDPIHGGDGILGVCTFPGLPSFVLTGGEDGKIVVTNWTTGATHQSVAAHKHDIRHFYYNTPQRLLLSCSRDKLVKAWRVGEDARINHLHTLAGHSFVVANVCSNDDGSRIVSGSRDNTVRMWDSETGAQVKCKETPRNLVHCLRWVHNHTVVQGGENLKLYLWDMRDDNIVLMGQPIEGIKDQPVCMSVSPTDNNYVLVGYKGFTDETAAVRLWDIRTRKPVHVFKGHRMCVTDVGYLPTRLTDKPLIVSASQDRTVRVWNSDSGECVGSAPLPKGGAPTDLTLNADTPTSSKGGDMFLGNTDGSLHGLRFNPVTSAMEVSLVFRGSPPDG